MAERTIFGRMKVIASSIALAVASCPCTAQGLLRDDSLRFVLQGNVFDKQTAIPIEGAKVSVAGSDGSSFSAFTNGDGAFLFEQRDTARYIVSSTTYRILVQREGYLDLKDQSSTMGITGTSTFVKEYFLQPGCTGGGDRWSPLVQFAWKSDLLDHTADSVIQEVVAIMHDNPGIVIRIHSRYESTESIDVAEKRCEAVRSRLIEHGVHHDRLVLAADHGAPEAGSTMAFTPLADPKEREAHRALNRVVEFLVLRMDWKPE